MQQAQDTAAQKAGEARSYAADKAQGAKDTAHSYADAAQARPIPALGALRPPAPWCRLARAAAAPSIRVLLVVEGTASRAAATPSHALCPPRSTTSAPPRRRLAPARRRARGRRARALSCTSRPRQPRSRPAPSAALRWRLCWACTRRSSSTPPPPQRRRCAGASRVWLRALPGSAVAHEGGSATAAAAYPAAGGRQGRAATDTASAALCPAPVGQVPALV